MKLQLYCIFQDEQPLKGGRGHASLVIKCKLCSRENSIGNNMVAKRIVVGAAQGVELARFSGYFF